MKISAFLWRCLSRSLDGEGTSRHQAWDLPRSRVSGRVPSLGREGNQSPHWPVWNGIPKPGIFVTWFFLIYVHNKNTHQTCEVKIPISVVSMRNILSKAFKKLQRILHISRLGLAAWKSFRRDFPRNIRNQTWLKSHVNIRRSWRKRFFCCEFFWGYVLGVCEWIRSWICT